MMDSPKKKQKMQSLKERACIICSKQTSESELTKPRDDESVGVLLHAANLRNFGPILELKEDEYGEKLFYHRDCRSDFTHKKMLQKFQEPDSEPECSTKRRKSSRAPSTTSRVFDPVCIFCEKESKYVAGSNTRETLLQSRELRSDETVRSVAQAKLDQRILAITSRELVAAEAHYHKSCYRKYTRGAMEKTSKVTEDDDAYLAAEREAYLLLFKHVRKTLFVQPEVVRMMELTEKLLNFLHELGINDVKPSTKKHIRRKLECEFKKSLHFVSDDKGKLLVYPDGLSLEQVVVKMMKAEEQLQDAKYSDDIENIVKLSANHLRGQIKNMKEKPWPPHPAELKSGYTELPESLKMFLKLLLHGTEQDGTQKVERVVQSVGQDCIYAVSRGKVVPAKHILLPWGVKSLTGNVELIKMLNRLGHGVSYSKLEEIDTALCLQKQMKEADRGIVLPSSSHPCIPSSLAYDNIDRLEETLSGGGTSHRVNGIMIQPQVHTAQPQETEAQFLTRKEQSVTAVPLDIPEYNAGNRLGPPVLKPQVLDLQSVRDIAMRTNLVWSLTRLSDTKDQSVSSWTGFNMQISGNKIVHKDTVGYLPTINAPATQLSTVHHVLIQVMKIKTELDLDEIVCVFDQALYAKAMEIKWKNGEIFQSVVIRMGTFHTLCNLMSIIGKRFASAGLRDLAVESGIIAEGSITSVLEGRHYNRGVRLYKLLYEALLRLAWKGFYLWLAEHHSEDGRHIEETITAMRTLRADVSQDTLESVLPNDSVSVILTRFLEYLDHLHNNQGQLASFWASFLDLLDIMLDLIRASREGNWLLHLSGINRMIPWCFAYDKQNYARCMFIIICIIGGLSNSLKC